MASVINLNKTTLFSVTMTCDGHVAVAQKSGTKMAPWYMEPKTKACVTVAL